MQRPPSQPPELPGYRYEKLLGTGGFADVFLYEQAMPRQKVAVKVLFAEQLSPATRAAFVAEANAMARLGDHPFIVKILGASIASDGRPYLVMEYLPGPSFADKHRQAPFTVVEALRAGIRLSSAVATAHAAGIVHSDIKPANVLTTSLGWPKLADFGIASNLETDLPPLSTGFVGDDAPVGDGTSQTIGLSIPWSAPEVFDEGVEPNRSSDLFSLAATVYTTITGHSPFVIPGRSNSSADLMGRIDRGAITPISRSDVPLELSAVLQKGMAHNPAERYASAVDFARALQGVEQRLGYAPTELAVENLDLAAPATALEPEGADRTTIRSIPTIEAQPVADDPTVVRSHVAVRPEPAIPAHLTEETVLVARTPAAVAPSPNRVGMIALAISGGLLVIVAVVVVVAVTVFGAGANPDAGPTKPPASLSDGGALAPESVPGVVMLHPSADGTTVTFTWTQDDAEEGDTFVWTRTDVADAEQVLTTEPTALVEGVVPGETVCVDVVVVRNGKESIPVGECLMP